MTENFLGGFIQLILDFVIYIVNILLIPFDFVIDSLFPDISNALGLISDAFNVAFTYVGYILDSSGLYGHTIVFIVEYIIFRITLPLQIWVIKTAINLYNKFKP